MISPNDFQNTFDHTHSRYSRSLEHTTSHTAHTSHTSHTTRHSWTFLLRCLSSAHSPKTRVKGKYIYNRTLCRSEKRSHTRSIHKCRANDLQRINNTSLNHIHKLPLLSIISP